MKKRIVVALAALGVLCTRPAFAAVGIGANFTGSNINNVNVIPPDTDGAAGLDSFAEFINGQVSVYRKSDGSIITRTTDTQFWANAHVTLTNGVSDPRIIYDQASGRWFASQVDGLLANGSVASNNFLLAVSQTSDPAGAWQGFAIKADNTNTLFADFPTLGVNADGVYLSANMFTVPSASSSSGVTVVSIPKADLLAATPSVARRTIFPNLSTSSYGYALQPIVDFGPSPGREALLAANVITETGTNSTQNIRRASLQNTGTATATLSAATGITVSRYASPFDAAQPGTSNLISTNDARFGAVTPKVGSSIWAVDAVNNGGNAGIRWYQIDEASNAVLQSGTLGDATYSYYYPSIAVNARGDVVIGFTRSGSAAGTGYASAGAIVGTTTGSTTTFGTPMILKQGVGTYFVTFSGTENRWGDYSATSVDPADPSIFWTIQEWASATNIWSTQVTELVVYHAGEFYWQTAANGAYATGSNWFPGTVPTTTDAVFFSRPGNAYTVTFATAAANDRAVVRQGTVTWNLGGNTYSLTNSSPATPSLTLGDYQGTCSLTVTGGPLQTAAVSIGSGTGSNASLTVTGAGTTWNSSLNVYVGGSSTGAGGTGTLNIASGAAAQIAGTLQSFAQGTVNVSAGTLAANSLNLAGPVSLAQSGTLGGPGTISGPTAVGSGILSVDTGTLTVSGSLAVTGTLTKIGGGTLTISGPQSHGSGAAITVQHGTVNLDSTAGTNLSANLTGGDLNLGGALPSTLGDLSIGSGLTLGVLAGANWTVGQIASPSGNVTLNGALTTSSPSNSAIGGVIGGSGTLAKLGAGSLTLSGNNTFGGGTTLGGGATIAASDSALGTGAVLMAPPSGTVALSFTSAAPLIGSLASSGAGTFIVVLGNPAGGGSATALSIGSDNTSTTFAGTIGDGSGTVPAATGSVTKVGTGTLTLSSNNTYTGGTVVSAGVLVAASDTALGPGPALINPALGTATLQFTSATPTIGSLANSGAGLANVVLGNTSGAGSATALNVGGNNASTVFSGAISDLSGVKPAAVGSLIKTGAGTLTLSNSNTYAGGTIVLAGTLRLGNPGALGAGPLVLNGATNAGAVVDLNGNGPSVAALSGTAGTITDQSLGAGPTTLEVNNSAAGTTYAGLIQDNTLGGAPKIALKMAGTGELVLTSAPRYQGNTDVTGGTLTYNATAGTTFVDGTATLTIGPAGKVNVAGTIDPFTTGTLHTSIVNDSLGSGGAAGLNVLAGSISVNTISGTGDTSVAAGASLSAVSIQQDTLTIGAGASVVVRSTTAAALQASTSPGSNAVPEPGTRLLLASAAGSLAAAFLQSMRVRRQRYHSG